MAAVYRVGVHKSRSQRKPAKIHTMDTQNTDDSPQTHTTDPNPHTTDDGDGHPLNHRQRAFVRAYMASGNATQAITAAGYSSHRASETGSRMIRLPHVADAIRRGQADLARRSGLDADKIVADIRAIHDRNAGGTASAEAVALQAATTLARIAGLLIDRRASTTTTARVEVVITRQETRIVDGRAVLVDGPVDVLVDGPTDGQVVGPVVGPTESSTAELSPRADGDGAGQPGQ
jgi:hypothetical protein